MAITSALLIQRTEIQKADGKHLLFVFYSEFRFRFSIHYLSITFLTRYHITNQYVIDFSFSDIATPLEYPFFQIPSLLYLFVFNILETK